MTEDEENAIYGRLIAQEHLLREFAALLVGYSNEGIEVAESHRDRIIKELGGMPIKAATPEKAAAILRAALQSTSTWFVLLLQRLRAPPQ